jgi:hypothetical protein
MMYSFSWVETEGLLIWNSHHTIVPLFWFKEWNVDAYSSRQSKTTKKNQ